MIRKKHLKSSKNNIKKNSSIRKKTILFIFLGLLLLFVFFINGINFTNSQEGGNYILITKAEHLDSNREFISDIYNEVREQDNVWSETISNGDYLRVTFEQQLDNTKDITVYPRIVSGNPRIEVFEVDKGELIAEFTNLRDEEYNKVFLTNLKGSQDTFDLRVVGGSLKFDHIIDPDTGVVSVENFGIVMTNTGAITAYSPFTKSQNMSNSVPFVTKSLHTTAGPAEDWINHLTRVTLNSTGVILTRNNSLGRVEYNLTVVEFDASSVKVQNGSLCAPTPTGCNTAIGDSINTSRAAMVFYSKIDNTTTVDDDYNSAAIRGNITNSTHLTFYREDTAGTIIGTWYIFESLDGSFTVQSRDIGLDSTNPSNFVAINSVQTNKTFLIASYQTTQISDNARDGSTRVELTNSTAITATSGIESAHNINLTIFAITFTGDENVQRGTLNFSHIGSSTQNIRNDSLNAVDLSLAMPWNPVLTGRMSSDTIDPNALQSAFSTLEFINSTSIQGTRGVAVGNTTASYEIIEWVISAGADTTPPTITIDSPTNTTFSTGGIDYNITLDEALHTAFYSLDSGSNLTLDNDSNTHYFNISGNHPTLSEGFHNITFWVNDTLGNANESTVFFTFDKSTTISLFVADTENMDDTYVRSDNLTGNFGSGAILRNLNDTNNAFESMIQWNISSIPSGQTIQEALFILTVDANNFVAGESINVTLHRLYANYTCNGDPWDESCPTWENRPDNESQGHISSYVNFTIISI